MTRFTDDLLLLEELRRAGSLTDDEFVIAKARVLTGNADAGAAKAQARLAEETNAKLQRLELQNQLMEVENRWDDAHEVLMVSDKYGKKSVPTGSDSVAMVISAVFVTVVLSVVGAAVDSAIPVIAGFICLLFLLIGAAVMSDKANRYAQAESYYLSEKSDIESQIEALETGRGKSGANR
ncbi:MAG: hypothetical protein H7Y38_02945 [Armatimonadetes bacterium]|nr:hypothetical protein [Armatimonadota bacterium]